VISLKLSRTKKGRKRWWEKGREGEIGREGERERERVSVLFR
jgi:hypothetical protein